MTAIWGASSGADGAAYYRLQLPLATIKHVHEWRCEWGPMLPERDYLEGFDTVLGQKMGAALGKRSRYQDMHEMVPAARRWLELAAAGTHRLVYEVDDDYWSLHEGHGPHTRLMYSQERLAHMAECIRAAHLVTVTTEHLASVVRKWNTAVMVIPNHLDEAVLSVAGPLERRNELGAVRVGWQGSDTHRYDFGQCWDGVRRAIQADPMSQFVTMGADYRHAGEGPPDWMARRTRFWPWVDNDWPAYFAQVAKFDIGLAPLEANRFNESKSDLKALEYAALGIPVIASPVGPYRQFVVPGGTGLLARSPRQWQDMVTELMHDQEKRLAMGVRARQRASERTIQRNLSMWVSALGGHQPTEPKE